MNFFKRAIYSIKRRIGKSLILFLVIFILMNVMAGAISINLATLGIEKVTKQKLGAVASIDLNSEAIIKSRSSGEIDEDLSRSIEKQSTITEDLVKKIGALEQVDYFNYTSSKWGLIVNLKTAATNFKTGENYEVESTHSDDEGEIDGITMNFEGISKPEMIEIRQGRLEIVEGEIFSQQQIDAGEPVILVSKPYADINKLSIGSEIEAKEKIWVHDEVNDKYVSKKEITKTFKVIGIFDVSPMLKEQLAKMTPMGRKLNKTQILAFRMSNILDQIYTTSGAIYAFTEEVTEAQKQYMSAEELEAHFATEIDSPRVNSPVFVLKNPDDLESFRLDATALLGTEYLVITASSDTYDKVAGPINSLKTLSKITLTVAILASILIIGLIVLLFLRDRKEEFGIYLALGEKRFKILLQVLIEVVLIVVLAITVSVYTGNVIASKTSENIINREIKKEEENEDGSGGFGSADRTLDIYTPIIEQADIIDSYKVDLSLSYVGLLYAVGLGSAIVSIILPMSYVLRLKPKKILM